MLLLLLVVVVLLFLRKVKGLSCLDGLACVGRVRWVGRDLFILYDYITQRTVVVKGVWVVCVNGRADAPVVYLRGLLCCVFFFFFCGF